MAQKHSVPQFHQNPEVTITVTLQRAHISSLKGALDELRNSVGKRLETSKEFAKEDALTYAAAALGTLRGAIHEAVPGHVNPYFE